MITYSETFYSAQGEGQFTGRQSLWVRFHLCNLQCNGFGQDDPTDPETYDLPYENIDLKDITVVEDLPVFEKGCDSSYTWAKKFKHLMRKKSASDLADELEALLPHGKFIHPDTGQDVHMVFTGGEPMMKSAQKAMLQLIQEFEKRNNLPKNITIETNGTKPLTDDGAQAIRTIIGRGNGGKWFWSISPKLWSTAGEKHSRAIKPDVVGEYYKKSRDGQLKYVVNGSEASWTEVQENTKLYRIAGVPWDVWIMGVGGTVEGLKLTEADIADETIQRGYAYTTRAHCHIYGNAIGK